MNLPISKLELIKIEMPLLQSRFDKYDDLIYRNRNWFITLWVACMGLSFTAKSAILPFLGAGLSILYWVLEGFIRYNNWYKYVLRYRTLRDELNKKEPNIENLSVFDLTNKYCEDHESGFIKFKACFFRLEPIILYSGMAIASLLLGIFLASGIINFLQK